MVNSRKIKSLFDDSQLDVNLSLSSELPDWFQDFKQDSLDRFMQHNIPSVTDSEWEYTKIDSLLELLFNRETLENSNSKELSDNDIESDKDAICIHFHNGQYSTSSDLPDHIKIFSKSDDKEIFRKLFKSDTDQQTSFLSDMNSIIFSDTLFIRTLQNQKVDTEIHIINHSHHDAIIAPRLHIHVAENSALKVFEHVKSSTKSLISHLMTIFCETGSNLEFYKLIEQQKDTHILSKHTAQIAENSKVNFFSWDYGGKTSATNTLAELDGKESEFNYSALFTPSDDDHSGNKLRVEHKANKTKSRIKVRGVLNDHSKGVFFGKIKVKENVLGTSALMENKNLLISDDATISTTPILEIYNDDTECSHSATSGSIDEEKLFYIQSRGISELDAKQYLIGSFIKELINEITNIKIKTLLQNNFKYIENQS
ncbi:MAG: Fe-S cluster assembly protein SufD [Gammaproteobacteria bacterium]|jgi:Fe-S cluster assembly protein SufD|nr:Fe-S cluster assembly protein SufD [Gammaproteobacteria bacterium]MDC0188839.1 Fe-S cluster assembly protein SufD [Gammaproteobacteria bacterium]|tara:strand:- start:343 stop:1623 length:1281 start_codon:yes stop_codon:yes gene_type:complete